MGKKIDRFVLYMLSAALFYLYFLKAFENHALSIGGALLCLLLEVKSVKWLRRRISSSRYFQKKRFRKQASGMIMHFACEDYAIAEEAIRKLVENHYQCKPSLKLIQAHPGMKLSQYQLFDAWKSHRGEDKLVICATCKCEADVRAMASSLRKPHIAILDSDDIKNLAAENPGEINVFENRKSRKTIHLEQIARQMLQRRNAPRCTMRALSCTLMYILGRNFLYLFMGMLLFFAAMLCVRRKRVPAKLF